MKTTFFPTPALTLLLAMAGLFPASAGVVTLSSPDNKWKLASDEWGSTGEALAGGVAQRDFGSGLTSYSWASGVFLTEGGTRQWLTGNTIGVFGETLIGSGNVISDSTVGNVRTSAYTVPGFVNLRIELVQTVSNSGITQRYSFTNTRATAMTLGLTTYHDVDLDAATALSNTIALVNGTLKVSDGSRDVYFAPSSVGYAGFFAGFQPGGGITSSLDQIAFNNSGIPAGTANGFWNVSGAAVGANLDANNDQISDLGADAAYLFQNNFTIPANSTVSLTFGTQSVPEPSSAVLALMGTGLFARRRRR